ncbi:hypothetical protein L8U00_01050 [Campylobacter sp. IFREMER_LSEM_CL2256]|uniref:hypothetical protein n=1 Tax=Campylobacter TaxID=194 RepID=UPI0011A89934|nr:MULTISPECIES: hypothetical protein [Campylobacter]MCV3387076.1 hypothetical protein [Campylobacter sp. IFREMER_LSEM_CL2256]
MTAYVHIGIAKTGTTSIQNFLYQNKELLLKQGVFFPQSIGKKEHRAFAALNYLECKNDWFCKANYLQSKKQLLDKQKDIFDSLCNELQKFSEKYFINKIIISSEGIQAYLNSEEEYRNLKNNLEKLNIDSIKIIIYIRNQFDLYCSLFSQRVKNGRIYDSIEKYASEIDFDYENVYEYKKTIEYCTRIFGIENVIVGVFEKDSFFKNDLIEDFCNKSQIKLNNEFLKVKNENETLNLLGMNLLLRLNSKIPYWNDNGENITRKSTNLIQCIEKHLSFKHEELKFYPKKRIYDYYMTRFEDSNEWIKINFFKNKEELFKMRSFVDYKENYKMESMYDKYFDSISSLIFDLIKK